MQFESQWPGDDIAAPFCPAYDRGAGFFEGLGRLWNRVDSPADGTRVLWPAGEHAHRRDLGKHRPDGRCADTAPTNFAGRRAWITSLTSILTELRSRLLREHEIRRIRAAWETIDNRTLKDIGISRYEIEYARDPRHWSRWVS